VKVPTLLLRLLAPVAAVLFALVIAGIVLRISGNDPREAFSEMWSYGTQASSIASIAERAAPLYLSGVAFAIAFKMGLFNIGVEGQYRMAALFAAFVGANVALPAPLHILLIFIVAMAVGATWAGIAGVLKVTRGVHEVITTIMLNLSSTALAAYLLKNYFLDRADTTLNLQTEKIPESGRFPNFLDLGRNADINGVVLIAVVIGVFYYLLLWRTRFGYDLRASGLNPFAAQASGVSAKAMVVKGMLLSGAVAGLVGLPTLLSYSFNYGLDFDVGLGFTGITVALLGRNHPVGIGLGAILLAFLDRSAQILDLKDIPKEISVIMEGVIVLSVVIAYELVQRLIEAQERRSAAEAEPPTPAVPAEAVPA